LLFRRHHIRKILQGEKTQTRRLSSKRVYQVGKIYRIKRDWFHYSDIEILITRRWRERLGDISTEDVRKEGYETLEDFKKAWIEIHGYWNPDDIVWVYEFKVIKKAEPAIQHWDLWK